MTNVLFAPAFAYRKLTTELQRRLLAASKPQLQNLALLTQALVFSQNCHLPNLALQFPVDGRRDSLIQRLVRFLDNCRVTQRVHYLPLVADLLAHWPDRDVNLVMDRTDIENEKSILLLAAAFKHRALPLAWRVLPFGGTGEACQLALLKEMCPYLPSSKRVTFFDSEFRAVGLQRYCRDQDWGWQVGVKSDTLFRYGDAPWQPLCSLPIEPGQRRYLHDITMTRSEAFSPVHVGHFSVDKHRDYARWSQMRGWELPVRFRRRRVAFPTRQTLPLDATDPLPFLHKKGNSALPARIQVGRCRIQLRPALAWLGRHGPCQCPLCLSD